MNALDFLIDFSTLIHTSMEPQTDQNENMNAPIDSSYYPGASSLSVVPSLPFEHYDSTQQAPNKDVACNYAAISKSPRQMFPSSSSCLPNYAATNVESQGETLFSIHHDNHASHILGEHAQEDLGFGLPSRLISATPQAWHSQPEHFPQRAMCYECTLSFVPNMWCNSRRRHGFEPAQYHGASCRFIPEEALHVRIPCNDRLCQCWTHSPRNYCPNYNAWPTWNTAATPYDPEILTRCNEWPPKGTPDTHSNAS